MDILIDLLSVQYAEDRRLAAQLLGTRRGLLGDEMAEASTSGLRVVAANDTESAVRVHAVHTLGELRDPQAAPS